MGHEISMLSLVAAVLYLAVAALCGRAAYLARRAAAHRPPRALPWHRYAWIALAVLFLALAMTRFTGLEEAMRQAMREFLRESGEYDARRRVQGLLAAGMLTVLALFAVPAIRAGRTLRGRRERAVGAALAAGAALLVLLVMRVISHHSFDALLYGPLKINWVIDIGASGVVLIAALYYARRMGSSD